MENILSTIKKLVGVPEEQTDFDEDILLHINTAFGILDELGVGPDGGFTIEEAATAKWSDYITDRKRFEKVKTYVYLKTKLYFDPPTNSSLLDAMKEQVKELEWRLCTTAENSKEQE